MSGLLGAGTTWGLLFLGAALAAAYFRVSRITWTATGLVLVATFFYWSYVGFIWKLLAAILFLAPAVIFNLPALRRKLISDRMLTFYRSAMPEISQTERDALEAGGTWWDAELFSGMPRWRELLEFDQPKLSEEEIDFLSGPVEHLCGMLDDYAINNELNDLTPETWQYIKEQGFFGMIIPREFGGKEFSAAGHAQVVMKIATRSISAALTVMIPNSVGPAKLLLRYGTEEQKNHYLPRLARGEEIPCFALTGPEAGSDASAMPDTGVVCRGEFNGKKDVLGIRLNFDKRYITLGPIATVLGLAFKLYDPDGLLGKQEDRGITLALVPADTPGISKGSRHKPLHMAFLNGPLHGENVFIPIDWIIGGPDQVGKGWRMLMESLTDGRSISLPALSTAAAKVCARVTGAYATIRKQFRVPIGQFEGVQEALARIAGNTYAMDSVRRLTLAAVDAGYKPSVISGIAKYNLTARCRQVVNDAVDVHGGAALCLGPKNLLGQIQDFPAVGVTVEGHNILTRNLIVFGQGAIRCHPHLLAELEAAYTEDEEKARQQFDRAVTGHIGFSISNAVITILLGLSGARFAARHENPSLRYGQAQLTRMSTAFAFVTDILLLVYRGEIKRRERLSGRMADIFSQLLIASAAMKHFDDQGREDNDVPLITWVIKDCLAIIQVSFDEVFRNLRYPWLGRVLRAWVFPLGRSYSPPSDALGQEVAEILLT
ncbi:MAG: acyl-CoA dehydrogenase, partial [Gammaproteobacteria bacterium]